MNKIKKPKWEKKTAGLPAAKGINLNSSIPTSQSLDVGMTAHATHKSDCIIIKITKIENKFDAEGTITQIIPKNKKEPQTDLMVGDKVFINRFDIDILLQ